MNAEVFKPSNSPEIIALQFQTGKMVESKFGTSQVMFTLVDGRVTFLPPFIADRIREEKIAARQPFEIVRHNPTTWDIKPLQANLASAGQKETGAAPRKNTPVSSTATPAYGHQAPQQPPQSTAAPAVPPPAAGSNRLMACFLMSIDAIAEAQSYAKRKELSITFTAEDVRAAALSCYINMCKEGR